MLNDEVYCGCASFFLHKRPLKISTPQVNTHMCNLLWPVCLSVTEPQGNPSIKLEVIDMIGGLYILQFNYTDILQVYIVPIYIILAIHKVQRNPCSASRAFVPDFEHNDEFVR